MTVEANPAETAANARTGTAAMDAVPAFTAAPAQAAPYGASSPHPAPTPMAVAAAPLPHAPARTASGGGGGKGLILGLVGVGAVLLGAILILVVKGNKPKDTDLPPIAINTAPATASQGVQPIKPLDPVPTDTAPPVVESAAPSTGGTSASPADTAKPAGAGKPATGSGTTGPATPKGDACEACLAAASSGNATGVSASLSRCTDSGKQAACKSALQRTALGAVKSAAMNGNCARAQTLASTAEALGVRGAANGLKGTSCK
jgi:hypothetical protein